VPRAARDLERSDRFGKTARELDLADRAEEFVDELPERLRGGSVQDALRSAATRGVAFLATGVLSLFFLIHGPRLLAAAANQLPAERQEGVRRLAAAAYLRAWRYLAGSLAMALVAGLLAYATALVADLPGPAPLALWVALFDLVPLVGVVVGALPLVLLALADSPARAVAVAVVFVAWQLVEAFVVQRRLEERSLHLGPFVTVAVAMVGLELYGIGGSLAGVALAVAAAALADELLPTTRASEPVGTVETQ
jgi:predicted PurR-regulated permease PerM